MDLRDITILSLGIVLGVIVCALFLFISERRTETRYGLIKSNIIAYVVTIVTVLLYNKFML